MNAQGQADAQTASNDENWVRETQFGKWFLSTDIWVRYVLGEGLDALLELLDSDFPKGMRLVDAGCGQGKAFRLLDRALEPSSIFGIEIDPELIERTGDVGKECRCEIRLVHASVTHLPLPAESVDLVFCHQLLHHVPTQRGVLQEFHRVLVPGGRLLVAESCRSFIQSSFVRALFRHPMAAQKTADEYLALVRSSGFEVPDSGVATSSPWWSQPDFGLRERLGWRRAGSGDATEIALAARKPGSDSGESLRRP